MKKIVALILLLCMMLAAFPVFAESAGEKAPAGSGLENLLSGLLGGSENGEGKESDLGGMLSGLVDELKKDGAGLVDKVTKDGSGLVDKLKKEVSELSSKLKETIGKTVKEKIEKELSNPDSKLASLLASFAQGISKGGDADLESILGLLFGGGTPVEGTDTDDGETLEETMKRLNEEAKAETGDGVPGKKEAKSVEEFYGQWKDSKFTLLGEDYDMSEYNEGVFIGENTYYVTQDGQKSPDYLYPETAELTIVNGILKINSDGHWSNYVLTEDGSIVNPSGTMMIYLVRAE